ncbi:MAG: 3-oxoacyl-ACP reductase [Frankiales bacterium]|jgi:3-oxoacyl-[acyl-carrier protein] reductase|nr:3-oxoacyl-ACP reductase [Frankiales bacterium]
MRLRGRVGVVTGASRGIGKEVATALAEDGMSLLLLARTGAALRELAEQLAASYGVRAFPAAVDVADPAAVERVVAHAEQHLGPVDLLVNNAARIESAELPFWQSDLDEVWSVVETNLRGPLLLTRALLPSMVARGHGRVVNVASLARAATQTGTYTGYAVSKRALSVLTASLAGPLSGTGVVVLDVLPGLVRTALTEGMPVWRDRPEQVWDEAAATARVVVDVARGRYDDRAGTLLDAPSLAGG